MSATPNPVIAIDGTAASGKSTFSRWLAQRLGYAYVNTGAMYRGVTWYLQQKGIPLEDAEAVGREVLAAGVETRLENGELAFRIAGIDPLPHVRDAMVNAGVSLVAQVGPVRKLLVAGQQSLAALAPLVMEGRDIGTIVFPQTPYKFFLDADAGVRAQRRSQQGETDAIQQRDNLDQKRENSPLMLAPDALRLDSGRATVEELVAVAMDHLAMRGLKIFDEPFVLPLWEGTPPHSHSSGADDLPTLTVYLPKNAPSPVPALLVLPGGGYEMLCADYEGSAKAEWFQRRGGAGFVLRYRLPAKGYRHPVPLLDAQRAIRLVRAHAAKWNIDPTRIGVMGFSAGGHLAATLATHFDAGNARAADPVEQQSCRPDFIIPVYPVISMKDGITHPGSKALLLGPKPDVALVESLSIETQVTPQTPPTLLVHSIDDTLVPIEHSRLMLAALQKAGVPSELHEYPTGGHGFGGGPDQPHAPPGWLDRIYGWLKGRGLIS